MRLGFRECIAVVALAAMAACSNGNPAAQADGARADSDSIVNAARIDSLRLAAERDSAVVRAERDSLAADPSYKELKGLVEAEAKDFPKELMPGLMLVGNYLEGREFFYMYAVDERQMDFKQIATNGGEMRQAMAESIKKSVEEKGNPMGRFVDLCITCGVRVNYMFKSAQSHRTVTITFSTDDLRRIRTR